MIGANSYITKESHVSSFSCSRRTLRILLKIMGVIAVVAKYLIHLMALSTMLMVSLHAVSGSAASANQDILFNFQRNAPADSILYSDGLVNRDAAVVVKNLSMYNLQLELLAAELEVLNADKYSAEVEFLVALLNQGLAAAQSQGGLRDYYGLEENLASAFYLDGLIPVLQLAVADKQSLINAFNKAGEQSSVEHKAQVWGRHAVDYWVLQTEQDLGFNLWLTLAIKDQVASIALIPAHFSQARRLDALGLLPEAYSLADSRGMAEVRESESFLNYAAGFVNVLEFARLMTDPHSNKAGEDLIALLGQEALPPLSVACRRDWLSLAQGVPKLVFGYDSIDKQAQGVALDGHMLLKIESSNVTQALKKLNGHIPNYVLSAKEALLSVAVGVDMGALMPVISQLRRQALSTHFDCEELIAIQGQLMSTDLSVLMVAAAAGQGISGIGAIIYDVNLSAIASGNLVIDALVSVTTQYPELVSSLASFVPQLETVEWPIDGSSVALNLPNLPVGLSPRLAIKGKHVVLFDGPMSAQSAGQMSVEKLNKQGVVAIYTNYKKLGAIANDALGLVSLISTTEASDCAEVRVNMASLSGAVSEITTQTTVENKGIRLDFNVQINNTSKVVGQLVKAGRYQLKELVDGCKWLLVGSETIAPDGTGQYEITDDTGQCTLYQVQYNWQQQGSRLVFRESASLGRDSCGEKLQALTVRNTECIVLNTFDNGFDCLFTFGSDNRSIYRYVAQP